MIEQEIARARERPRSAGVRWKFKPALIIAAAVLAAIALALVFKNVLLGSADPQSTSFSDASASSTASGASDSAAPVADPSGTGTSGAAGSSSGAGGSGDGVDLKVYVTGAVLTPGVYPLGSDSRIEDAIAAAGGFTESADPLKVNLASRVSDGQQIYVPTVGEQVPPELAAGSGSGSGGSGGSGGGSGTGTGGSGAGSGGNVAPVNINTATSEQLQELPGIGPALAERILQWRSTNGNFRSVEELDNVSGIGPALMGRLRDQVQI